MYLTDVKMLLKEFPTCVGMNRLPAGLPGEPE